MEERNQEKKRGTVEEHRGEDEQKNPTIYSLSNQHSLLMLHITYMCSTIEGCRLVSTVCMACITLHCVYPQIYRKKKKKKTGRTTVSELPIITVVSSNSVSHGCSCHLCFLHCALQLAPFSLLPWGGKEGAGEKKKKGRALFLPYQPSASIHSRPLSCINTNQLI